MIKFSSLPPSTNGFDNFKLLESIGEGAFGTVNKAIHQQSGKTVAIKRISVSSQRSSQTLDEVEILSKLDHPNIIGFIECFSPISSSFWIVIEYMHTSLSQIIRSAAAAQQEQQTNGLRECDVKAWVKMLFSGLRYLHDEARIFHRDITPSNLLVDGSGQLKIGDFGMACSYDYENPSKEYDHRVCTRWYRAPELLFGSRYYGPSVDIWAAGCIMAELYRLKPLFAGCSDIDQLCRVVNALGTPRVESWPELKTFADYGKIEFPDITPIPTAELFEHASLPAIQLLSRVVRYNKRSTAAQVLEDVYFTTEPLASTPPNIQLPPIPLKSETNDAVDGWASVDLSDNDDNNE